MKKLTLTSFLLVAVLGFTSCSVDENSIEDAPQQALYEKAIVQRDASGAYSVDYKLSDGADSEIVLDDNTNMNDIYLYPSTGKVARRLFHDLSLNGRDNLKVGINNTVTNSKSIITVFDDDIKFSKEAKTDHLEEYKMTDNADGTYSLDFTVNENITVEFVQKNKNSYEIHLTPGTGKVDGQKYTRTFTRNNREALKIVFVNYFYDDAGRTAELTTVRKPRVSVDEGSGGAGA